MATGKGGIYQRGGLWLDYDRKRDGTLRSPYLYIFRYDPKRERVVSTSTRTSDIQEAQRRLDIKYLEESRGASVCQACGQPLASAHGFLVHDALTNYQLEIGDNRASSEAIRARLAHVVDYIETLNRDVRCDEVDERFVSNFRVWMAARPIVSKNKIRSRSPGTIENSVVQLAAAMNHARQRGDIQHGPKFKTKQPNSVNQSPRFRATVQQLADMMKWALEQGKRGEALRRYLIFAIGTLARPEEVMDFSTNATREQWSSNAGLINLNPIGRPQTKKYRTVVRCPRLLKPWLDSTQGQFVRNDREAVASVKSSWDSMRAALGLPEGIGTAPKCIRRSMSALLRARRCPGDIVEMQMGHRTIKAVTEGYAPFDPAYLNASLGIIEEIMDEIETLVPGAFHRSDTGKTGNVATRTADRKI